MRGEVRIGHSIYGVVVINGSLCSRVYGMSLTTVLDAVMSSYIQKYNYSPKIDTCSNRNCTAVCYTYSPRI